MGSIFRRACALLLVASPVGRSAAAAEPQAASAAGLERRLALAATAAAEATLRLHETDAAKKWLVEVPEPLRAWEWRHLAARADESLAAIAAHEGRVLGVSVSPDGKRLATAGADGIARLWDAATGKLLATFAGHGAAVWGAVFSPDGARLATASEDKTVKVWDAATGKVLRTLTGHSDAVHGGSVEEWGRESGKDGLRRHPFQRIRHRDSFRSNGNGGIRAAVGYLYERFVKLHIGKIDVALMGHGFLHNSLE